MNVILIGAEEIDKNDQVVLQDRRSAHIINVLHGKCGDRVRIGILNGPLGLGRIIELTPGEKTARVVLKISVTGHAPELPMVDLILALPRPIMLKKILTQAASMGVGRIFLINAKRVEKSFFHATLLAESNYRSYLLQGLEQAVATKVPEVFIHNRFRPFVEDHLPIVIDDYSHCIVAHPGAAPLHHVDRHAIKGRVLLAVGPEGGWIEFEIDKFRKQGFVAVGLGERILRVDTAVVALLAQISMLRNL
jgi:16S rRNA (uracil1498-N3)-methyltransferase